MFKMLKNTWNFFKAIFQLVGKLLGVFNESMVKVNDNLDKFNYEMNIKNILSKIKIWDLLINNQKAKTPIKCVITLGYLCEVSKFTGQSIEILEAIKIRPELHKDFSSSLDDVKKELQKIEKSKEYKKIVKFCRSEGLDEYREPLKVFDFYFSVKSFEEIEQEAKTEQKSLLIIKKANLQAAEMKGSLLIKNNNSNNNSVKLPADTQLNKARKTQQQVSKTSQIHKTLPKPINKKVKNKLSENLNNSLSDAVYITKSNGLKIVSDLGLNGTKEEFECLYDKSISFILSTPELNLLHIYKKLCSHPKDAFSAFKKVQKRDTKQFVWEGGSPAYHYTKNCTRLNSEFTNLTIPIEIQEKGDFEIEKFRIFVKEFKGLLEQNESKFLDKLEVHFLLKNRPKSVKFHNSGVEGFVNYDLSELKEKIDKVIDSSIGFMNSDKETLKLIKSKGFGTHKLKEAKDPDHKLYTWHNFKIELKELLRQYYRVRFNPELKFEKSILDQIGFHPCKECKLD